MPDLTDHPERHQGDVVILRSWFQKGMLRNSAKQMIECARQDLGGRWQAQMIGVSEPERAGVSKSWFRHYLYTYGLGRCGLMLNTRCRSSVAVRQRSLRRRPWPGRNHCEYFFTVILVSILTICGVLIPKDTS